MAKGGFKGLKAPTFKRGGVGIKRMSVTKLFRTKPLSAEGPPNITPPKIEGMK